MPYDPVSDDHPEIDRQYPAELVAVHFKSHGCTLIGVLLTPQGTGPHPVIILLHGFPGNERNFDLAHIFRRAGWSVLVFHYRGTWGSQGIFSFQNVLEDVATAVAFLRTDETRENYRIDGGRIVLMGHSLGGFAALMTLVDDDRLSGAASFAGFNLKFLADAVMDPLTELKTLAGYYENDLHALNIPSGEKLFDELRCRGRDWDLCARVPFLLNRPLLLIGAGRDMDADPTHHHFPLVRAFQKAGAGKLTHKMLNSDHYFSDQRVLLVRSMLSWLRGWWGGHGVEESSGSVIR